MADTIVIEKGATYKHVIRWETYPIIYADITAITQAAPCIVTAAGHGLPDGWRIDKLTAVKGMTQINTHQLVNGQYSQTGFGRRFSRGLEATVIDEDTIELNQVNATAFGAYSSGGVLEYYTPLNMAGYTAQMQIRATVGSADVLLELNGTNERIIIDNSAKTITLTISATDTAALTFSSGVASLEMKDANGVVTFLINNAPVSVRETDITRD